MRVLETTRQAATVLLAGAALAACTPAPLPLVPPDAATSSPAVGSPVREVVIGVDRLAGGFNPHTLADLTPTSTAIAGLLLPSAFRQRPDGQWVLDDTLLISAEVTGTQPFTVTYRIRHDAQWSDTAPIAAEDFGYLAEQMRSQPGVVDSAGYQLIDQVISRDGGKTAEVVFHRPYAGWRTLFRHLLPAHLLKDAPGGWSEAFDAGVGVSGGPFAMLSLDPARGELLLVRNDRYWDTPAGVDRILLRQSGDAALVDALRTGGVQAALFGYPDAITGLLLSGAGLSATVVPQPIVASVLLRPASAVLDDPQVRTAVAAALDRPALIATGVASGPSAALRADSQVIAPTQPGYRPTAPAAGPPVAPDPATVDRLLTEAGYARGPQGWERGGKPLSLVVGAPADREPYGVLATRIVDQLRNAGIDAELRLVEPGQLFGTALDSDAPPGQFLPQPQSPEPDTAGIDIAVVPQPTAADPGTELASWSGCPLVVPASRKPAPSNPAGLCDLSLQPLIEQALSGTDPTMQVASPAVDPVLPMDPASPAGSAQTGDLAQTGDPGQSGNPGQSGDPAQTVDAVRTVDAALWERAVTIPLYQQASLLVSTDQLQGVLPGTPLEGPFDGAERWQPRR